jgi:AcrR family transcriptional regulator
MKKSKKDQEKTRLTLIEVAIDLMIQKGYEKTTMREIARTAKVGDATIYNYFSTKETIVWAYIQHKQEQAVKEINLISDFKSYTLQEKIQTYFETILEGYLPDREFLPIAFKMTHQSFLTHTAEIKKINTIFLTQVRIFLEDAIKKKEIPEQPIDTIVPYAILDLYFIIVLYWSKDNSDKFTQTTELIDLLGTILMGVLQQGLIAKAMNLGSFLLRHHLFSYVDTLLKDTPFKSIHSELKRFTS